MSSPEVVLSFAMGPRIPRSFCSLWENEWSEAEESGSEQVLEIVSSTESDEFSFSPKLRDQNDPVELRDELVRSIRAVLRQTARSTKSARRS